MLGGYGVISDRSLTCWLSHALLCVYHLSSRPDLTSMLVYEVGSHGARQTQETSNYLLLLVLSYILVFSMKNNKLKTFKYRVGCWGNSLKSWRGCLYFERRARPILSPHFGHQVEAAHQNCQSCLNAFRNRIKWVCVRLCVRREGTLTSCRYCTQIRETFFPHFAIFYQEFHWKSNSNKVTPDLLGQTTECSNLAARHGSLDIEKWQPLRQTSNMTLSSSCTYNFA